MNKAMLCTWVKRDDGVVLKCDVVDYLIYDPYHLLPAMEVYHSRLNRYGSVARSMLGTFEMRERQEDKVCP